LECLDIAIGVLVRDEKICLSKRQAHQTFADKWEFPGGKVEAGESVVSALKREFKEELGIDTHHWSPLIEVYWDYGDIAVTLHTFKTHDFMGEPTGIEGQIIKWFRVDELQNLQFPEANNAIIEAITRQGIA